MNKLLVLKRPLIWIKRFRHRCGYGVHSPFAFNFITNVIYEKCSYYAYKELTPGKINKENGLKPKKINRLLFRLVNWAQPETIINAGAQTPSSDYLKAAKSNVKYIHVTESSSFKPEKDSLVDFVYIHSFCNKEFTEQIFYTCLEHIHEKSVFVIQGIHYSKNMKALWLKMINESKVCITFDLYDIGIILFDRTKIKQNYIVNFY